MCFNVELCDLKLQEVNIREPKGALNTKLFISEGR